MAYTGVVFVASSSSAATKLEDADSTTMEATQAERSDSSSPRKSGMTIAA